MTRHLTVVPGQPEPLPECGLCETPTRRDAWTKNGGLCTECAGSIQTIALRLRPVLPYE